MTWFKVDDSFHSHPKVLATPPAALGLWVVAGAWCSANLTDGFVPDHVLPRLLPDSAELAGQLVASGLWRRAKGGHRFHDWHTYQPTKQEAIAARDKKASGGRLGNHRRWHEERGVIDPGCPFCQPIPPSDNRSDKRRDSDRGTDGVTESHPNAPDPVPSRPDPTRRDGPPSGGHTGDQSVRAGARVREATHWLNQRYGLTEHEASQVITQVSDRATEPIKHIARYLAAMAEGDLAHIVAAVMDGARQPAPLAAVPDLSPPPELEHEDTGDVVPAETAIAQLRASKGWRKTAT